MRGPELDPYRRAAPRAAVSAPPAGPGLAKTTVAPIAPGPKSGPGERSTRRSGALASSAGTPIGQLRGHSPAGGCQRRRDAERAAFPKWLARRAGATRGAALRLSPSKVSTSLHAASPPASLGRSGGAAERTLVYMPLGSSRAPPMRRATAGGERVGPRGSGEAGARAADKQPRMTRAQLCFRNPPGRVYRWLA